MKRKSKFEDTLEAQIEKHLPKGTQYKYESKRLPFTIHRYYLPDFVIYLPDGNIRYIEAKGYFRNDDRVKLLAVKEHDPTLDIRMIFMADNKIHKHSKMRYSDWCTKHGFPYSIGSVPREWLK